MQEEIIEWKQDVPKHQKTSYVEALASVQSVVPEKHPMTSKTTKPLCNPEKIVIVTHYCANGGGFDCRCLPRLYFLLAHTNWTTKRRNFTVFQMQNFGQVKVNFKSKQSCGYCSEDYLFIVFRNKSKPQNEQNVNRSVLQKNSALWSSKSIYYLSISMCGSSKRTAKIRK